MNKEDILAMSREENKNRDEMEQEVFYRAAQKACAAGGFVCMLIICLEGFIRHEVNFSIWTVYLTMSGTLLLMKYRHLGKKHELYYAVIQLVMAAGFFAAFVFKLFR